MNKRAEAYERGIQKMDIEAWTGRVAAGEKKLFRDCWVVGGAEGVMATCTVPREGYSNLIYVLNGDDGNWWVTECFDEAWLPARIAVMRRVQDGLSKT